MQGACLFRGREVRDALDALAGGARFVALVGPSGAGTSAVLRAVVAGWPRPSGRVALVPCRGAAALDELLPRVAGALGLEVSPSASTFALRALIGARLDAGALLLALDDLAGVDEAAAALLDWLAVAPELRVVAACAAPPPGAEVVAVAPLAPAEARSFLVEALRRRQPEVVFDEQQIELGLRHAGGLPVALGVVAARMAALGGLPEPADTWPRLEQTMRRALDALPPRVVRAATALAALRGPFSLPAARAVVGADDADDAVEALRGASLVERVEGAEGPRFRLLVPLREALVCPGDARERHALFFSGLPAAGPGDRDDLLAAFDWLAGRRPDDAIAAALLLDSVLVRTGPVAQHLAVLERARRLPGAALARARAHRLLGRTLALHGRGDEAARCSEEDVRLCEAGAGAPLGWALMYLCFSARIAGRLDRARWAGLGAVAIGQELADDRLLSMAHQVVGLVDQDEGDHGAAIARFVEAEAHGRRAGDPRMVGICAANHAMSLIALGDGPAARACVERAQGQFAQADDQFHLSRVAWMAAAADRLCGDLAGAARRIAGALARLVEAGDEAGELEAAVEALAIARAQGDSARIEALSADLRLLAPRVDEASVVQRARRALAPAAAAASAQPHALRLARGGGRLRGVWLDGAPLELGRRGPLRSILLALGEAPGRAFSVAELLAIGWPGERMSPESGAARVYMTMRRLRAFGLRDLLVTDDDGYRLHGAVLVTVETVK